MQVISPKCYSFGLFGILHNDGNTIHFMQEVKRVIDKKALGAFIRGQRKNKNLNQSDVSAITGLSRNYISDIENGRYVPSTDALSKLGVCLDLDLNAIKGTEIQVNHENKSAV